MRRFLLLPDACIALFLRFTPYPSDVRFARTLCLKCQRFLNEKRFSSIGFLSLRFLCRPTSLARIRAGVGAGDTAGGPVDVRTVLLQKSGRRYLRVELTAMPAVSLGPRGWRQRACFGVRSRHPPGANSGIDLLIVGSRYCWPSLHRRLRPDFLRLIMRVTARWLGWRLGGAGIHGLRGLAGWRPRCGCEAEDVNVFFGQDAWFGRRQASGGLHGHLNL